MKIRWQLNKKELHTLIWMMGGKDDSNPGGVSAENLLAEEELPEMAERWRQEGYLVSVGANWRLEEGLQLAVSTLMDPESNFSCSREEKEKTEKKIFYFHGQTILLLEDEGAEEVELLWIPFLPLAIGAVSEMFRAGDKDPEGMPDSVIFHMEGCCSGEANYRKTIRPEGDGYVSEEDDSEKKLYSKLEIVHEVTDWLSANHKKCMEEVLRFE